MAPAADPIRAAALDLLKRVDEGGYADLVLDGFLRRHGELDPRDRALLTELVYGVLRQRGRLDFALARCCRQPLDRLEPPVLRLLRLGAHQLLHLDRIPDHAAVATSVELAHRAGLSRAAGLINGVLRALARTRQELPWPPPEQPLAHLEQTLSLPGWLARRWLAELGAAEALRLGQALLQPAPLTLRVNTLRCERERFLAALEQAGHRGRATSFAPAGVIVEKRGAAPLPGDELGWFQVQDQASQLIPELLGIRPGEQVLDACAAPGGKTTQLAALAGNQARIAAFDKHSQRVELVTRAARRLGCSGIEARVWDLELPPPALAPASFDRILVDAPCSGLGVLRRNPETRWRRRPEELAPLAALQGRILAQVAPLLKPGGTLVYAVCTVTPEETDAVLATFLAAHPDYARADLRPLLPAAWQPLLGADGALRTWPHRHDGMDAFFAARLRRA